MNLQFPAFLILPLLLTLLVVLILLRFIWQRRFTQGATALMVLMSGLAIWLGATATEYLVTELVLKVFWIKVQYIGIVMVPLSLLVFASQYINYNQWISTRNIILLAIIPALTVVAVFANEYHYQFLTSVVLVSGGNYVTSETTHGWMFWIHAVYSYILILIATIHFVWFYIYSPKIYRRQASLILIGVMMPWLANAHYIFGWGKSNIDFTPFAHAILGGTMVYSLFYFRFLDIRPIARRTIVEHMKDGVLVVDTQNRLADINIAASEIINLNVNRIDASIGRPVNELVDIPISLQERIPDELVEVTIERGLVKSRIVVADDQTEPFAGIFELQTQSLNDKQGRFIGKVISFHNITRLKESQAALRQAREELEERVSERTAQLDKLNKSMLAEIAERKLAEVALRESEQKYRELVFHAPVGIYELNLTEQKFESVNDVMCDYTGYTREEFMSLSPFDLLTDSSKQRFIERMQQHFSTGEQPTGSAEFQIKGKNGREFWVLLNSKWYTSGDSLKAHVVVDDITERKSMEIALQQASLNLQKRNQLLTQIIELGDALHQNLDLNSLLHEIVHSLGFQTAVLNLANEETQKVHVRGMAGTDEAAKQELDGAVYELEEFTDVMLPKYQIGRCYFVPAGEFNWKQDFSGPTYVPATSPPDSAQLELWHPEDFLLIPIRSSDGQLVGFISVDQPVDGLRPTPESLLPLEIFANQVASTLENAKLFQQVQQELEHRLRAEARIKASLQEKEVLLKEIHHRVKNNLQIISSLLNLQESYVADTLASSIFQESQNRVRSMALIHEKLYQSENLSQIDFAEYVSDLGNYLISVYQGLSQGIRLKVEADNVFLAIDTAVPCGLILNELISNALKHAFSDQSGGQINVKLTAEKDHQIKMLVSDNGVGLPPDFDWQQQGNSLGLLLVNTLINQLDGTLHHSQNGEKPQGGVCFTITFPLPEGVEA